jgi:predicted amidohydrolase
MTRNFAIAALQLEIQPWDGDATTARIEEAIKNHAAGYPWVDMYIAPELALSAVAHFVDVTPEQLAQACEPVPGPRIERMQALARRIKRWLVPGSIWELGDDGKRYNTSVVINPEGEIVAKYRKMYPWLPYEVGTETGDEYCVFDIPEVGRFGLAICYDTWFPEVSRTLAWMGAEVILRPTLTPTSDRDVELVMSRANAAFNQCYFIDVNACGPWGGGRSAMYDPNGRVLQEQGSGQSMLTEILDLDLVQTTREHGTLGLCQTWKQLRDTNAPHPMYEDLASGEIFKSLGALKAAKNLRN